MPKPRDISDTVIAAVVFNFLKKALEKYTGDQGEGKKKISKKASIKEGKSQSSAPSELSKADVKPIINDPKNFKRLKQKAKQILQEGKVKPTNNTAANKLLDLYKTDARELRNFTELDQGVDQIFTDTFINGLRNREAAGISRRGDPVQVEEEQPQPADDEAPTPSKKITTKKKKKKKVQQPEDDEDSMDLPVSEPEEFDSDEENEKKENIKAEFKNAVKKLKREIKSVEGKKLAQEMSDDFLEDSKTRGISGYGSYVALERVINTLINKNYIERSPNLKLIGTDLLYGVGEITQEEREEIIEPTPKEEKKQEKKREVPDLVVDDSKARPVPTKEKGQVSVPILDEMIKNVSRPVAEPTKGVGLTLDQLKKIRESKGKPIRRVPKLKPSQASERAKLEEAVSSALKQEKISTKKNVTTGFEQMGQRLDDINAILSSRPELKNIHADVVKQLEREGYDVKRTDTKLQGLGIDKKIVEELI